MAPQLVLSLFPGIGLLDMAFEMEGFCVVRGPDLLWGGNVRSFHPPVGKFEGVIGGPPCQPHSGYAAMVKSQGKKLSECEIPEFERVVTDAFPSWFVMENSPNVPDVSISGYVVQRIVLNNRWLGGHQDRRRVFQFGNRTGDKISVSDFALESPIKEPTCLASEGSAGRITHKKVHGSQKAFYERRREFPEFCNLMGLPETFLRDAPFTVAGKFSAVGNGVPIPMGRAIAKAIAKQLPAARAGSPAV